MEFIDKESKDALLKLSPSKKIEWLRKYSLNMERGVPLQEIQKLIVSLESEERQYSSLEPRKLTFPTDFDVFIMDIKDSDLASIGEEFGIRRLTLCDSIGTLPVNGIVYGTCHRIFVPLVVTKRRIHLNLCFLVDTVSPNTYLREDSFVALGFTESLPNETLVHINGIGLTVSPSRGHFSNVDLLGQDYFVSGGCILTVNYPLKEVIINN